MKWEFLNRWEKFLRLTGVAHGARDDVTARVRDAFSDAGAWITDVHFFSGAQTTLHFEVAGDRVAALRDALARAGVALDDASRASVARAEGAPENVEGTLAVIFAEGDLDLTHDVPAVPG